MWTAQDTRNLNKRLDAIERTLASLSRKLDLVLTKETTNMATLQDLQAQVAAVGSTEDSAVALINGMILKIQELINTGATPEQFQALVDDLKLHTDPLAQAVAANTAP